jgi:hypothetical protein
VDAGRRGEVALKKISPSENTEGDIFVKLKIQQDQ